jgi:hypothetical protein
MYWEFRVTPAKDAAEAKGYMEKALMEISGTHGSLLRALIRARDAGDEQSAKLYENDVKKFRDSLAYFAAVETFLVNEMNKKK